MKTPFLLLSLALALGWLAPPSRAKDAASAPVPIDTSQLAKSPHIIWHGQFGTSRDTPDEVYCLMGNGFLRTPVSSNFQSLITGWLGRHPHPKIIRVFNYGPILLNRPNMSQTYVWVVDGRENLNEYLVRQGGCPGITMMIPAHQNEPVPGRKASHFILEVSQKDLDQFLDKASLAEKQAQKEKLGIWKNGVHIF